MKDLICFLEQFTTEERKDQLRDIVNQRTRYLTIGLENIYQTQNASAVLRSCDCFGVQDVHIIENEYHFDINPQVVIGASKWLNLHKYNEKDNNTRTTLHKLKKDGYRIIATTPHQNDVDLDEFDLEKGKAAFIFGNEREGISDIVREEADEFLKIPMHGFSESLNLSVSAAITLQYFSNKLRKDNISWQLPDKERDSIHLEWLLKTIKKSDLLVEEFNRRNNTSY